MFSRGIEVEIGWKWVDKVFLFIVEYSLRNKITNIKESIKVTVIFPLPSSYGKQKKSFEKNMPSLKYIFYKYDARYW